MRRSNKLKVPPAVRAAARQAVNTQEIKGLGMNIQFEKKEGGEPALPMV